ncbi:MAG: tetratricopeptide repeat protein, partial [Pseudomonadota bacterium]
AAALEGEGYSLWWDRRIQSGSEFSKDIEAELDAAKAVVVCWSAAANESRWVKDEASAGAEASKLMAVSLDGEHPPIGFRQFHCADLSAWRGRTDDAAFQDFNAAVRVRITGEEARATSDIPYADAPVKGAPIQRAGALGLIALAVAAVLAVTYFMRSTPNTPAETSVAKPTAQVVAAPEKSIAVLPFADMSPGGDQEYFSDGVAEEILNALAGLEELRVAGRTSSFSFKGTNEDLRVIGERLNVAHVLEGSVRKQGDKLRVTAQLVNTADGFRIWAETYDRELDDIFAVQDEISAMVVEALKLKIGVDALPTHTVISAAAYDDYLLGMSYLRKRNLEASKTAIDYFERALAKDARNADAWAELARAHSLVNIYGNEFGAGGNIERAGDAVETALSIDPDHVAALTVKGWIELVYNRNFDASRRALVRARSLRPNDSEAQNFYADWYYRIGYFEEARIQEDRALELDPFLIANHFDRAFVELFAGELETAEVHAERALAQYPDNAVGMWTMAQILVRQGRLDEAKTLSERFATIAGKENELSLWVQTEILLAEGRPKEARALVEANIGGPGDGGMSWGVAAQIYASLGDFDKAGAMLQLACDTKDDFVVWPMHVRTPDQAPESEPWQAAWRKHGMPELAALRRDLPAFSEN